MAGAKGTAGNRSPVGRPSTPTSVGKGDKGGPPVLALTPTAAATTALAGAGAGAGAGAKGKGLGALLAGAAGKAGATGEVWCHCDAWERRGPDRRGICCAG